MTKSIFGPNLVLSKNCHFAANSQYRSLHMGALYRFYQKSMSRVKWFEQKWLWFPNGRNHRKYIVAAHPMRLPSVISWEIGVRVVTLWEDHASKPSTNVLTPPKLGTVVEVARDNIITEADGVNWLQQLQSKFKIKSIWQVTNKTIHMCYVRGKYTKN